MKRILALLVFITCIADAQLSLKVNFNGTDAVTNSSIHDSISAFSNQTPSDAGGQISSNMMIAYNSNGSPNYGWTYYEIPYSTDTLAYGIVIGAKQTSAPAAGFQDEFILGHFTSTNYLTATGHAIGLTYASGSTMYVNRYIITVAGSMNLQAAGSGTGSNPTVNVGDTLKVVTIQDSTHIYFNSTLFHSYLDTRVRHSTGNTSMYVGMRLRVYSAPIIQPAFDNLLIGRHLTGASDPPPATDVVAPTLFSFNAFKVGGGTTFSIADSFYYTARVLDGFANDTIRVDTCVLGGTFALYKQIGDINVASPGNKDYTFTTSNMRRLASATFLARVGARDSAGNFAYLDTIQFTISGTTTSASTKWRTAYMYDAWMHTIRGTNDGINPAQVDYTGVTHIILFGTDWRTTSPYFGPRVGSPSSDSIKIFYGANSTQRSYNWLDSMKTYAHAAGVKYLLGMVAIGTGVTNFSTVMSNDASAELFCDHLVDFVILHGMDGYDIDVESSGAAIPNQIDSLITKTRRKFIARGKTDAIITLAWSYSVGLNTLGANGTQRTRITGMLDQANMMLYGMGSGTNKGHNAPLGMAKCWYDGGQYNSWVVDAQASAGATGSSTGNGLGHGVRRAAADGIPSSKLGFIAMMYPYEYRSTTARCAPCLTPGTGFENSTTFSMNRINAFPDSSRFDDSAKVRFSTFLDGSTYRYFSWYDSIAWRHWAKYIDTVLTSGGGTGIGGVGYWAWGQDLDNTKTGVLKQPQYYWATVALGSVSLPTVNVPSVPTLSSPTNAATGVSKTGITLKVRTVSEATSYGFQVAANASFTNLVASAVATSDTTFTISNGVGGTIISGNTLYYWRARANNAAGSGSYSNPFTFTTAADSTTTTIPTLSYPSSNATGIPRDSVLRWRPSVGATSYSVRLRIQDTISGAFLYNGAVATDTSFAFASLQNSGVYWWSIRANVAGGTNSAYSNYIKFTVISAAQQPPSTTSQTRKRKPVIKGILNTKTGRYEPVGVTGGQEFYNSEPVVTSLDNVDTSDSPYWMNKAIFNNQIWGRDNTGALYNLSTGSGASSGDEINVGSVTTNLLVVTGQADLTGDVNIGANSEWNFYNSPNFSVTGGFAPFNVNGNSVVVPDLNAEQLSGKTIGAFLTLVDTVHRTGQTAAITTTNFRNTVAGETYLLLAILQTTTTGSGTGTFTLAWNSGAAKTIATTWNQASTAYAGYNATYEIIYNASSTPTWATSGMAGGVVYEVIIKLYKLP